MNINKTAVLICAIELMVENGSTTTLDVKNKLRKNHYSCSQKEVSSLMGEIASDEKWKHTDNGTFRTYKPTAPLTSATVGAPVAVTPTIIPAKATGVRGDWEVNATTKGTPAYYSPGMTRSAARWAFAKTNNVSYNDTRARKAK